MIFRSCYRNSVFFRDLIFMEVSEVLFGSFKLFIVRSVCQQFCSCSCAFTVWFWCGLIYWLFNNGFNGLDIFYLQFLSIQDEIYVRVDDYMSVNFDRHSLLELGCFAGNSLLELGCFAGSMVGSTILLFFRCFFWRSGLLECWIWSYVLSHWFGCSLGPGTPLNSPWTLDSSALSWSLTLAIEEQQL